MASTVEALHAGFLRSARRFPDRPAVEVTGETLSYAELLGRASAIAATLRKALPDSDRPLTAVYATRSPVAYAGVLGALLRGHGYVPLNPDFPTERVRTMLERSGAVGIVADAASVERLAGALVDSTRRFVVFVPDGADVSAETIRRSGHTMLGTADLEPADGFVPTEHAAADEMAYLLFTSGSTGVPKGVMVTHGNVRAFVESMVDRYGFDENDRFSQTVDLTFDLSIFNVFVPWECGACVCAPTTVQLLQPGPWIRDASLTVWCSVPSLGLFMRRLGMLSADTYPGLRWNLFCGEPLPVSLAQAFAAAAPSSSVENLYGPTELTVACMAYRFEAEAPDPNSVHGLVPIGMPLPGMQAIVERSDGREANRGEEGELLMTGPQLTLGYLDDSERTAAAFVRPAGHEQVYYRTGDVVRRHDDQAPYVFLGRVDSQVKISGYRVEMAEVEQALRRAAGVEEAVAVPWPRTESSAAGIVAFVQASEIDPAAIRRAMGRMLPGYMVPRTVRALAELPLNVNGKFDRKALLTRLEAGE